MVMNSGITCLTKRGKGSGMKLYLPFIYAFLHKRFSVVATVIILF